MIHSIYNLPKLIRRVYQTWPTPFWSYWMKNSQETIYRSIRQLKRGLPALNIYFQCILDRDNEHPNYKKEYGHLEGDTIVGRHHKSAVITLVEQQSKCIIAIKPDGRKALNQWFIQLPKYLFK